MGLLKKWRENKEQIIKAMEKREKELQNDPKYREEYEEERELKKLFSKWTSSIDLKKTEKKVHRL